MRVPLRARGMSLVEVLVAMVIGLFIVLVAATIYVESIRSFGFRVGQSENMGNSRYTLDTLASRLSNAGFRRDPTQGDEQAFPADGAAHPNGCIFTAGQSIYVEADAKTLCIRFQPRDNAEKDCAGTAAGLATLATYEAPPAPAVGAGMFVERYFLRSDGQLVCQAGSPSSVETAVADGVRDVLFQFGVGAVSDGVTARTVEAFSTALPGATQTVRSLRYAVLLSTSVGGLTEGMTSTVCTRWTGMGGATASCDTSRGQLYQLATGTLSLRNLLP